VERLQRVSAHHQARQRGRALVDARQALEAVVGQVQDAQLRQRGETLQARDPVGRQVQLAQRRAARAQRGVDIHPSQAAAVHAQRREVREPLHALDLRQRSQGASVQGQRSDSLVRDVRVLAQVHAGQVERLRGRVERLRLISRFRRALAPGLLHVVLLL
jgi:hypothetical protein